MSKARIIGGAVAGLSFAVLFISQWEGLRTEAYLDVRGTPTICYGETENVRMGDTATPEECRAKLKVRVRQFWDAVDRLVIPEMTPWQHGAFTSFAYNVGIGAFERSTLLRKFNAGNVAGACLELLKWKYAGGRPWPGLERRRASEHQLCIGAMTTEN